MDNLTLYDTLYALASGDGREAALFGDAAPLAREAFSRSIAGGEFPIVWFEVPLIGAARFDLHVALSRAALSANPAFAPGAGNGYDELFAWYGREEEGGGGLAFAYDVSEGRIDDPAVHVNVNNAPLQDMGRFFELASGADAARIYRDFAARLPRGWRVWYAGVHPGRPGAPVRVDCFVDGTVRREYARDPHLLEADLSSCGFSAFGPALSQMTGPILESPFGLELQFDVMRDGQVGPTLGLSASFPQGMAASRRLFGEGAAGTAFMEKVEGLGLADARWRLVPDAAFAQLLPLPEGPLALYSQLTFIKLRMREGTALDAKAYLQAGASFPG